jgi:hypothetical protein
MPDLEIKIKLIFSLLKIPWKKIAKISIKLQFLWKMSCQNQRRSNNKKSKGFDFFQESYFLSQLAN